MTSERFRQSQNPPPWAALRAGRIREPSRMAFWCDIFLSRDLWSRRKSEPRLLHDFPPSVQRMAFCVFCPAAKSEVSAHTPVGSRYLPPSDNTKPNSTNLHPTRGTG